MDTTSLRQGYAALIAPARRGGYHDAVDDARLTEIVAAHHGPEAFTDRLERTSSRFVDLAARLDEKTPTAVQAARRAPLRALRV